MLDGGRLWEPPIGWPTASGMYVVAARAGSAEGVIVDGHRNLEHDAPGGERSRPYIH
jgi:hypothetical protein